MQSQYAQRTHNTSSSNLVGALTNKILEMIILEVNKSDMQCKIQNSIINPLMYKLYKQLYPYLYAFIIIVFLMFTMLIALLICFFIYLRK
jgi:hypothetical protein